MISTSAGGDPLAVEDLPDGLVGQQRLVVFFVAEGTPSDGVSQRGGQSTVGRAGLQWKRNLSWPGHSRMTLVSITIQRSEKVRPTEPDAELSANRTGPAVAAAIT